jgi:hypothetical protein
MFRGRPSEWVAKTGLESGRRQDGFGCRGESRASSAGFVHSAPWRVCSTHQPGVALVHLGFTALRTSCRARCRDEFRRLLPARCSKRQNSCLSPGPGQKWCVNSAHVAENQHCNCNEGSHLRARPASVLLGPSASGRPERNEVGFTITAPGRRRLGRAGASLILKRSIV